MTVLGYLSWGLLVAVFAGVAGYTIGVEAELHRVLDYLDRHLGWDADWLRSGIANDEHHQPKGPGR